MDVNVEQKFRVFGDHRVEQIVETGQDRHPGVGDGKILQHLHLAPGRFDKLPAQTHRNQIDQHFPEVQLDEAEGEYRPDPEGRWHQISRRDAQDVHGTVREGQRVSDQGRNADELNR